LASDASRRRHGRGWAAGSFGRETIAKVGGVELTGEVLEKVRQRRVLPDPNKRRQKLDSVFFVS